MNIILTIKSILNYLYNNLIDLIYVKKIKFENGSEITGAISSNNIYDIKLLSQIIANKGFSFLCHTTKKFLLQTDVPTVYNDILSKYNNCDNALSSSSDLNEQERLVFLTNDYLYVVDNNKKLKRTSISDLSNPQWTELFEFPNLPNNLYVGNNYIIAVGGNFVNSAWGVYGYILDLNGNIIDTIDYPTNNMGYIDNYISYYDNNFYVSVTKVVDNNFVYAVEKIEDKPTYTRITVDENNNGCLCFIQRLDNKLFFIRGKQLYKSNLDYSNKTLCYNSSNIESNFIIKKNTILTSRMSNGKALISTDGGNTFSETGYNASNVLLDVFLIDDYVYGFYRNQKNLYKSKDLVNWVLVPEIVADNNRATANQDKICGNNKVLFVYFADSKIIRYCGYIKTVYTDSLTINGSLVSVNYYKFNEWKIAISDGGSNDSAIDTFFNFYGYENYFLLDLVNEQIALPRNSNLYTVMFVGDDFIDSVDDLISGNYLKVLTENKVIEDLSSNSVTFNSSNPIKVNSSYKFGELSALTLDTDCYSQNPFGITIEFSSGATATTLTDNSSIVWVDGSSPVPSANKTCLIFIWDNKGFYKEY